LLGLASRSEDVATSDDAPRTSGPPQTKTIEPRRPKYAIGTKFVKAFPKYGVFIGHIESFDGYHYKVFYPKDEDEEDLTEQDLDKLKIFTE